MYKRFQSCVIVRNCPTQTSLLLFQSGVHCKPFSRHQSAPIFATYLGCIIVSEIGDISRFESASKLVAYAGLDASVRQSGEFNSTQNKISKRGSSYLRRALWMAAFMSLQCDPALYGYYRRLKERGKSHRLCVTAVARKRCIIIWAIMNSKQPYVPNI